MRELTKSMLRMSWALPLFGVRQLTHLMLPNEGNQGEATQALDAVSAAAQRELGGALGGLYDTGDRLQRGVVDVVFGVMFLDYFDPARWWARGEGCEAASAESQRQTPSSPAPAAAHSSAPPSSPAAPASSGAQASDDQVQGWGPVPAS